MPKLKKGDVVRRVLTPNYRHPDGYRVNVGDLIEVKAVTSDGGVFDTADLWHSPEYIERVEGISFTHDAVVGEVRVEAESLSVLRGAQTRFPEPPKETKRAEILRTAETIIHGDREKDYGAPIDSFRRLAQAFSLVLGHEVTPVQAAALMIAMKLSRLSGGDYKDDTWVDLAGYAALGAEVRDQQ